MRCIAIAALFLLLAGCAAQVISASPRGIAVKKNELSESPAPVAEAHCASFGKKATLTAVEPITFGSQIHHYDCV